jgi:tetratricopeptide (TPR) repeat protein
MPEPLQNAPLNGDIFNERALLGRLGEGLRSSGREVVFVIGSGLSAPQNEGEPGVPTVAGVIGLIEEEFEGEEVDDLRNAIAGAANPYQSAFLFLQGRRGQQGVNGVIRRAVVRARRLPADGSSGSYSISSSTAEASCRSYDEDWSGWHLTPGMEALGQLAAEWPDRFGRTVLTTNFDPLASASIRAAGGSYYRTILHRDGNLSQTTGTGTHVVHLHGYWHGADTLHTPRQLGQARPQLRASLSTLLRDRTVVVLAYGGWDDVFTKTLLEVVADDGAFPEIIWTFRDKAPRVRSDLQTMLDPGIDRGNVTFYAGVDAHVVLPALVDTWRRLENPTAVTTAISTQIAAVISPTVEAPTVEDASPSAPVATVITQGPSGREQERRLRTLISDEGRPPEVPVYVGREQDLQQLITSNFRAAFVTGIGGQGKSALAATFFERAETVEEFDHRIWCDCREQSFRFEDHLLSVVRALAAEEITVGELAKLTVEALTELFARLTADLRLLMVFDNIDNQVDLERQILTGSAGRFLTTLLRIGSKARVIFTCRPTIESNHDDIVSVRLGGLQLDDAVDLFKGRGAELDRSSIERIHTATRGHALWIDVLAAHHAANSGTAFDRLLATTSDDPDEIATLIMRPIWQQLTDRPKIVLQVLAETVKPTTALQISDYLGSSLRYAKAVKAVEQLRGLNLIVVKRQDDGEAFELHPLVRAFIHRTYKVKERVTFIDCILSVQRAILDMYRPQLLLRPPVEAVRGWIEAAELNLNADRVAPALEALNEVAAAASSDAPVEYIRVASLAFARDNLSDLITLPYFDKVFSEYVRMLVTLGRTDVASSSLDDYELTLEGKDARYINLCDMRCHLLWSNRSYPAAIRWGSEGVELKRRSGVDTEFDSSHNLALAQRDAGLVDPALDFFLNGEELSDVTDPETMIPDRDEAFYGNVGRCLQFMGQIEPALACYRKSARLLEGGKGAYAAENQAYVRQWIGELLLAKKEFDQALPFFVAAHARWERIAPPQAERIQRDIDKVIIAAAAIIPSPEVADAFVRAWIKL